jgi:excinuclease ABC subunit B
MPTGFQIKLPYQPAGDQPEAIKRLSKNIEKGERFQTLLGVTGSGKTFTVANLVQATGKPTLVVAHNKTLAAQLASEFRALFPKNAVEYFVSYYDYYQPEAYLPNKDVYIDKDLEINEEIDRLRHAATAALLTRRDVIIVASVSCIYGLGSPEFYRQGVLEVKRGQELDRQQFLKELVNLQYNRSEVLEKARFRVRGTTFEIMRPDREVVLRIEVRAGKVEQVYEYDQLTGEVLATDLESVLIYPAKHFVVPEKIMEDSLTKIEKELEERLDFFQKQGKIVEAERLARRTHNDLELMREVGYCSGIENYSLYLSGRESGEAPYTLMDYFPKDFLLVIDESHVTIPQLRAMYGGDYSRKRNLVDYGFRLPSAFDNRPLKFQEFEEKINSVVFVSATPADYELEKCQALGIPASQSQSQELEKPQERKQEKKIAETSSGSESEDLSDASRYSRSPLIIEQIVRPTGLIDPEVIVRPCRDQVADFIKEVGKVVERKERALATTLTKKMAENLAEFLKEDQAIKTEYLHSEVDTLDRIQILENLREGKFDVLVGVNLLREGLDLPEVSLVAIFDADKEGFLRSETSLIQTIGRAARNVRGRVILYADEITGSMRRAMDETERRRKKQKTYNRIHNITPQTVKKKLGSIVSFETKDPNLKNVDPLLNLESPKAIKEYLKNREKEMKEAAKKLDFEKAALIRDEISKIKKATPRG